MKLFRYKGHEIIIDKFEDEGKTRYCVAIDDDVDQMSEDYSSTLEAFEAAKKVVEVIHKQEQDDIYKMTTGRDRR